MIPAGGVEKTLLRKLDSIPVLARAGAILPLSRDKGNSVANPTNLDICIFTGDGSFSLYEDGLEDGSDALAVTEFKTAYQEGANGALQTVTILASGDTSVIPADRSLRLLFKNLDWDKTEITVYEDGKPMTLPLSLTDSAAVEFAFDASCTYKVEARFTPKTKLDVLKDRTLDILMHSESEYYNKTQAWRELLKIEDLTEFVWTLERSFSPVIVEKILESF